MKEAYQYWSNKGYWLIKQHKATGKQTLRYSKPTYNLNDIKTVTVTSNSNMINYELTIVYVNSGYLKRINKAAILSWIIDNVVVNCV